MRFLALSCLAAISLAKVHRGVRDPAAGNGGDMMRELDPNAKPNGDKKGVENWYDKTYENQNAYYYRHIQNNDEPNKASKDHSDSTVRQFAWTRAYCLKACETYFKMAGVEYTKSEFRKNCMNPCLRTRRVATKDEKPSLPEHK